MRSKAEETFVIVETLICPLQISQALQFVVKVVQFLFVKPKRYLYLQRCADLGIY